MSKTFSIIELYQHHEVLNHFIELLHYGQIGIKVYCEKSTYELLAEKAKTRPIEWILKDKNESISSFIKINHNQMCDADHIIITTVFSNLKGFISLASSNPTTLILHNALSWIDPLNNTLFRKGHVISDRLRYLKFILTRQHILRKKLLDVVQKIALPTEQVTQYVSSKCNKSIKSKLITLGFGSSRRSAKVVQSNDYLQLSIPGSISDETRDYDKVLDAFKILLNNPEIKIRLTILGKPIGPYGASILEAFNKIKNEKIKVITFSKYIDQSTFDRVLSESEYLILPLKPKARFYIFQELLGLTKISGSLNDMVRFGLPAIIPNEIPFDKILEPSLFRYETAAELSNIILDIYQLDNYKKKHRVFEKYNLENQLNQFKSIYNL